MPGAPLHIHAEWFDGVPLQGAENTNPLFLDDYPTLKEDAEIATAELGRLTC